MPTIRATAQGAFHPTLLSSEPLALTAEQRFWIREVIDTASSDSQFADKAYNAIIYILTSGSVTPPIVTSLSPSSAVLGSDSFTLHVIGTDFVPGSIIIWGGSLEPTLYVSATELTTEVNMATAQVAIDIPVAVENPDGVVSDVSIFSLTPAVVADPSQSSQGVSISTSKSAVAEATEATGPKVSSWTDVVKKEDKK